MSRDVVCHRGRSEPVLDRIRFGPRTLLVVEKLSSVRGRSTAPSTRRAAGSSGSRTCRSAATASSISALGRVTENDPHFLFPCRLRAARMGMTWGLGIGLGTDRQGLSMATSDECDAVASAAESSVLITADEMAGLLDLSARTLWRLVELEGVRRPGQGRREHPVAAVGGGGRGRRGMPRACEAVKGGTDQDHDQVRWPSRSTTTPEPREVGPGARRGWP